MNEDVLDKEPKVFGKQFRELLSQEWAGVAVLAVFYILIFIVFSVLSPYFLQARNLMSIGSNMSVIGLMAVAGTPLIVAGGLDLSVAAIAGVSGVVVSLLFGFGINIWVACLIALALASLMGGFNGLLTTRLRLDPLIVTLGTMSIFGGAALVLTGGISKPLIIPGFNWLGSGRVWGVPVPLLIMLGVCAFIWWVMTKTRFGREIYATGGNPEASRIMGINVNRVQVVLYVVSAIVGAIAGIILAAMLGAAAPNAAGSHLLTVIAAIILGGTSLRGGRGSVWGTILAVLILGTLNNGLTLLDVSSFWQEITRGIVLIGAVAFDQIRVRTGE
ncbi:MAG: ABC transporter permease [Rhizobiales bacterium]|nr:ABC transporter permease [Hyphomicrobiales bacterium]NRB15439.1 ABC transporter permease [Hyphomicrobiales bacterium]